LRLNSRAICGISLGLAVLMLGACASSPKAPKSVIRTVGVISAIGDQFHQRQIGRAAKESDETTSPLQPWEIDTFVVEQASTLLGKRYKVSKVTHRPGAFAPDKIHFPDEKSPRGDSRRPIEEVVRAEAKPQGLDAYVVITRGFAPFADTKQVVRGLGVAKGNGVAENRAYLHALYWMTVIDGRSFKIIGDLKAPPLKEAPRSAGSEVGPAVVIDGPNLPIDARFATDNLTRLTLDRQRHLKTELHTLLGESLPMSLAAVKLLD
jgi:hypothetical protein